VLQLLVIQIQAATSPIQGHIQANAPDIVYPVLSTVRQLFFDIVFILSIICNNQTRLWQLSVWEKDRVIFNIRSEEKNIE
jgi:hypothetical protein